MKFTKEELERQRLANVEHSLRAAVDHAIDVLEYIAENPLASQDEYSSMCENLVEELKGYLC